MDLTSFVDSVTWNADRFKFNKVISGFTEFYNKNKSITITQATAENIAQILKQFAPGFEYKQKDA